MANEQKSNGNIKTYQIPIEAAATDELYDKVGDRCRSHRENQREDRARHLVIIGSGSGNSASLLYTRNADLLNSRRRTNREFRDDKTREWEGESESSKEMPDKYYISEALYGVVRTSISCARNM